MDNHPSCPQPSFKFDPLPDPANHIRLLEILDADHHSPNSQVTCRLTTWPRDAPGLPSYYAISYMWGKPGSDMLVQINDKPFPVRRNCEFVLKQAHCHGKSQYYWIDAICIDQANLDEKSKQVAMMGDIYKWAAHVLACVGDHADDSLFFCKKMQEYRPEGKGWKCVFSDVGHGKVSWKFRLGHRSATPRRLLLAAALFATRPYFTRLWILQELRNARDFSLLCGMQALDRRDVQHMLDHLHSMMRNTERAERASMLWQPFEWGHEWSLTFIERRLTRLWVIRRIMPQLPFNSLPPQDYRKVQTSIFKCWEIIVTAKLGFPDLLAMASSLDCDDMRDKIYGIISIIDWGDVAAIVPDYTQNSFQTAVNFIRSLTTREGNIPSRSLFGLQSASRQTVRNLGLDRNSQDVPDAIRARRGIPNTILAESELPLEDPGPFEFAKANGWCLSADHLDRSRSEYSIWTPFGHGGPRIYLPRWSRPGDWVIQTSILTPARDFSLLVMREVAGTSRGHLIGRGFGKVGKALPEISTQFKIHWDAEDLVIFCLTNESMRMTVGQVSDAWLKDFLDVGVCKQTTPWSSWAIRIDDI